MRIWIDATRHDDTALVFGMGLLERLLRSLAEVEERLSRLPALEGESRVATDVRARLHRYFEDHRTPSEIRVELSPHGASPEELPPEITARLPVVESRSEASFGERLAAAVRDAGDEPLLALSADTVVDERVLEQLVCSTRPLVFFGGTGEEHGAALRIDGPLPPRAAAAADLVAAARACLESGAAEELCADAFDGYVLALRRNLPAWLFRIPDATSARKLEAFLFWSTDKATADFLTKYVYPRLVWRLMMPLARRRIAPNAVTGVALACGFAAISFFAAGLWGPGLALAYATSVLDAVDGKLARLTLTASRQGAALDHALDVVHPPLWYGAWAWGLSGGDAGSTLFHAGLWMVGLFVVDRLLANLFESCTGGRSPRGLEPLGGRLRSLGSCRNVNLALFTAGLALGRGTLAFYAVGALQLAAVLHHLAQVVRVWNVEPGSTAPHAPRLQPLGPSLDALGGRDS